MRLPIRLPKKLINLDSGIHTAKWLAKKYKKANNQKEKKAVIKAVMKYIGHYDIISRSLFYNNFQDYTECGVIPHLWCEMKDRHNEPLP